MFTSKTQSFVIGLILTCICIPLSAKEKNQTISIPELKFENSNKPLPWAVPDAGPSERLSLASGGGIWGQHGLILPKFAAVCYIKDVYNSSGFREGVKSILSKSTVRTMSEEQQKFVELTNGNYVIVPFEKGRTIGNYMEVQFYAVSQDDAEKIVNIFLEDLVKNTNENMQELITRQKELEKKIADANNQLDSKEKTLETVKTNLRKNKGYLSEEDAYKQAKETLSEMNKMLHVLDIERAGIHAKIDAIQGYLAKSGKDENLKTKLEGELANQTIELKVGEAKYNVVLSIHQRQEDLLELFAQRDNLKNEITALKFSLKNYEEDLARFKARLSHIIVPDVYENTVTIHPIEPEK